MLSRSRLDHKVSPDYKTPEMNYQPSFLKPQVGSVEGKLERGTDGIYLRGGKRALDTALAAVLLIPFVAIVVPLAAIIATDGANPFFSHQRVGRNGQLFHCWKLRTMVPDAEDRLASYLSEDVDAAREWAEAQKLSRDPRVTRIGRFLRRTSLDELPQLWNVLVGDMSLVGPRPITAGELPRYGSALGAYLRVRPGITGLWQVRGRNQLSFADRAQLDSFYARSASLRLDIAVLFQTIPAVLKLTGK